MAEWIINLGEAAEYMFDHNIFQDNLVGVDFCEQMVKETNPGIWAKAQTTAMLRTAISTVIRPLPRHYDCAESVQRRVLSRDARHEPYDA